MAETPALTLVQVMKAAHDAEFKLWSLYSHGDFGYGARRDGQDMNILGIDFTAASEALAAIRSDASWRAALRALPAEFMAKAAYEHHRAKWLKGHESEVPPTWEDLDEYDKERSIEEMQAALLAAAAEGEAK